uniref:Uncharacterized protein n=1 Tax=Salix viminalis TaxID=40686 RepID=A0A6N2NFC2_SALVM
MYRDYIDPEFKWMNFDLEEQAKVIVAPRSNNELDATKLKNEFPEMLSIKESILEHETWRPYLRMTPTALYQSPSSECFSKIATIMHEKVNISPTGVHCSLVPSCAVSFCSAAAAAAACSGFLALMFLGKVVSLTDYQ